ALEIHAPSPKILRSRIGVYLPCADRVRREGIRRCRAGTPRLRSVVVPSEEQETMPSTAATVEKPRLYAELEDRLLARDQVGGSRIYYELLSQGRRLPEIMAEAVRIHAPYTHVPYHQRIDDGFPNFVNNDHCLLSARAAINLEPMLPEKLAPLPLA